MNNKKRCQWCLNDPLYIAYHDQEWGVPLYDDQNLFAFLNLEGMQAGLSWLTVLKKRPAIEKAFAGFDPKKIIKFSDKKIEQLMKNTNIIRNRRKITAVINNAEVYLRLGKEQGAFSDYLWDLIGGKPINNARKTLESIPAETELSQKLSKELKTKGFKFVGPTICYAFMQAVGMVNDHLVDCFCYNSRHSK